MIRSNDKTNITITPKIFEKIIYSYFSCLKFYIYKWKTKSDMLFHLDDYLDCVYKGMHYSAHPTCIFRS